MGQCAFNTSDIPADVEMSAPVQFHECLAENCVCADWVPLTAHLLNRRFMLKAEGAIIVELKTSGGISVLLEREVDKEFSIVFRKEDQDRHVKLRFLDIYDFLNLILKLKIACRPILSNTPQCEVKPKQTCSRVFSLFRCRRHCSNCGYSFCSDCLEHEALIPSLAYSTPQRICQGCTRVLSELRISVLGNKSSSFVATRSFIGLRPDSPSKRNLSMSNMAPDE